jgi:hypothetical protein
MIAGGIGGMNCSGDGRSQGKGQGRVGCCYNLNYRKAVVRYLLNCDALRSKSSEETAKQVSKKSRRD